MTTIVFIEKENHVEVAYDSKVSHGYSHNELEGHKVFESAGILYGVAGAVSVANIIEGLEIKPPKTSDPSQIDKWVTFELLGTLRKILSTVSEKGQFEIPVNMLVVVNNRVYDIGSDYSRVRYTNGRYSIGSGSHYAKGALDQGATAEQAVKVASQNDSGTGHAVKSFIYRSNV